MGAGSDSEAIATLRATVRHVAGVELLMLFGSRARQDAQPGSDWDLGYIGNSSLDQVGLLTTAVAALGTDRVDLVDLDRASGLLRYCAARDGVVLFEAWPDIADQFRLNAVRFWCDASPVLARGYDDILAALPR